MNGISKIILFLALTQLGACAVISKQQCLDAQWNQIGYNVALKGNVDKESAFEKRERACAKHGETADWDEFEQGHSDGSVEYCQLRNAVDLGVRGITRVITNEVCPEHDYPGFNNAFNAGYQLYILDSRVDRINASVSDVSNHIYRSRDDIKRTDKKLTAAGLESSERKRLKNHRRKLRDEVYHLEREISRYQSDLYRAVDAQREYADYLDRVYIYGLSQKFVDPRKKTYPIK